MNERTKIIRLLGDEKRKYVELMKHHPKEQKIGMDIFDTLAARIITMPTRQREAPP